jgi:phosphoglycolate phosphatase
MIDREPTSFIFDLDGTLVDSLPGIEDSMRAAFVACGFPFPEVDLRRMIGPPVREILARLGSVNDPGTLSGLESAFRTNYDSYGWKLTVWYPGAVMLLQTMRQFGKALYLVTNKPRHITVRILEAAGVIDVFGAIATRDSREPHYSAKAEMVRDLISAHRIPANECVLTGDTIEDAEAATTNGIRFAFMTHGYGHIAAGSHAPVHFRFNSFLDFMPQVGKELGHD